MSSYIVQGFFPVMESVSAIVVTEKDKPLKVYGFPDDAVGLQFGIWEVPDADNDEMMTLPPTAA